MLVIVPRRIGDVLLATPVLRSLKQAWPGATLDALVFSSTAGVLAGNPDVTHIHTIPERPGWLQHIGFIAKIFRRYELALSLLPGDRPTFYAFFAGRKRRGLLLDTPKHRWKRRFLDTWVAQDVAKKHTVLTYLSLLQSLQVPLLPDISVGWREADQQRATALLAPLQGERYVVLHLYPKFNYKMWSDAGWIALARWAHARGLRVVLTGGNDSAEQEYINRLANAMTMAASLQPLNLAGRLSLNETACVLARAAAYVGPDTAVTHMAAALDVPTVALFGPTDPVKWGPWPSSYRDTSRTPWQRFGDQSCGRVRLLQGRAPCVPCGKEGCARHLASFSDCLRQLPPQRVTDALADLLQLPV